MGAEPQVTEALARLEHKVDVMLEMIIRLVGPGANGKFTLTPVGDPNHICSLCFMPVSYQVDIMNRAVVRKCGCTTGKTPPIDLGAFAPPVNPKQKEKDDERKRRDEDR
jgi:hypothetical protein